MGGEDDLDRWLSLASERADAIAEAVGIDARLYAQLAPWYARLAQWTTRRARNHQGLLSLGVQGVQGSGKSTLAAVLGELLRRGAGLGVVALSLDDLYFTRSQRQVLGHEVHPLLATRGAPGTHDIALGVETIAALRRGEDVALPRFDKARDDRAPRQLWPLIETDVDVLLFEGWFVGSAAPQEHQLAVPINDLEREQDTDGRWRRHVCAQLRERYPVLWREIDALCVLQAPDADCGFTWRWQAQQRARQALEASGGDTSRPMDEATVRRFADLDMRIARFALATLPATADAVLRLDTERRIRNLRFNAVAML